MTATHLFAIIVISFSKGATGPPCTSRPLGIDNPLLPKPLTTMVCTKQRPRFPLPAERTQLQVTTAHYLLLLTSPLKQSATLP